jgi:nicotinamidase-related amidase
MIAGTASPATIARADSALLLIDFQAKLMPAISEGAEVVRRAALLAAIAEKLNVPIVATEQNRKGLGATIPELAAFVQKPIAKQTFDAFRDAALLAHLPADRRTIVVAGCEAHVCVLQTVLGLLAGGFRVAVTIDATGSRREADKQAALSRLAAHGAELVTTEMVAFEWLAAADDPAFRSILERVKPL